MTLRIGLRDAGKRKLFNVNDPGEMTHDEIRAATKAEIPAANPILILVTNDQASPTEKEVA